jgi:hypothetical protein
METSPAMRYHSALLAGFILSALGVALPSAAASPRVQDICLGNGTSGPFSLSWKHIVPETESVSVNGLPQLRGLDYTLDADNGAITFAQALSARSAAEVTYEPDPAQAQRNSDSRTIPLSVDLLRGEHGYFSFNALGKQNATAGGDLTLGLGLGLQGAHNSQLTSHFFYTPVTAISGTGTDSTEKRLGMSVAGSASASNWAMFSFGFARAGVGLQAAGDDSPQAGQQLFTLSSRLAPTKMLQAQVNFSQSKPTDDPNAVTTKTSSVALTMTPNGKTQLSANLGQSTAGTRGATQTVGLSVDSHPTAKMEVSASYSSQNAPGTDSDSQAINLKTVLTPNKVVSVQTTVGQSRLGTGTTDQQAVQVSLNPRPTVQLGAGLALRQKGISGSPDTLSTAVASVNGTVHPLSFVEFSGSYKSRMAPATDTDTNDLFDTSTAKIALVPIKSLRFTGTYAQNPDDGGNTLQRLSRKGLGLETTFGALGLSGGYDWSRSYGTVDVEEAIHADLGLRFSQATQLTVGFLTSQNALTPATSQFVAYTVGFTHALGDRFSLSLNGKRRQSAASASDYDASANLGMKF